MKKLLLSAVAAFAVALSSSAGVNTLYGIGQIDGWGNFASGSVGQQLTKTADGVFTWSGEVTKTVYIAFASQLGDWNTINSHRFSPAKKDAPMVVGDNAMVANVDTSWKLLPGTYTMTINTNTMIVTLAEQGSVEKVYTYAIHGQLDGLGDQDWGDYPLEKVGDNEDLWAATYTPTVTGGQFGVKQLCNDSQSDWYSAGVEFNSFNTSNVLNGTPEGNCTYTYPADTECTFTFVPSTKTLTITAGAGVSDITVDADATAAYYNLQGIRVANPVAGQLYIRKAANKTIKVIF